MQVMHGMRQLEAPPTLDDAAAIGNDVFTSEVDNSIDNFAPSPKRAKGAQYYPPPQKAKLHESET